MNYITARNRARDHRKNPTTAEKHFWERVKKKQFYGFRFNRQYVFKYRILNNNDLYFILDFICFEKKIAFEIDGEYHNKIHDYDNQRDTIIRNYGWNVIHFSNEEVISHWYRVEKKLLASLM